MPYASAVWLQLVRCVPAECHRAQVNRLPNTHHRSTAQVALSGYKVVCLAHYHIRHQSTPDCAMQSSIAAASSLLHAPLSDPQTIH